MAYKVFKSSTAGRENSGQGHLFGRPLAPGTASCSFPFDYIVVNPLCAIENHNSDSQHESELRLREARLKPIGDGSGRLGFVGIHSGLLAKISFPYKCGLLSSIGNRLP